MTQVNTASPEPASKSRLRLWIKRILRAAVIGYLVVTVIYWFSQNSFIFPGAATQGLPDAILHPGANHELLTLRAADGTKIVALFGKALNASGHVRDDASHRPTVLFFYGNGACAAYCVDIFDRLRALGLNVIIPDYEGYGMSDGKPSEAGCYAAADAAYDYLLTRPDIDHTKFIAVGWSLGAAVAIDLTPRRPITHLVTISAFTSLPAMARIVAPLLPTSLLLRSRFDNAAKFPNISCPILMIHGTRDTIVPFAMMDQLAKAASAKVTRLPIDGKDHNDVLDPDDQRLWDVMAGFFGE